jgi:hypothetical protein
VAWDGMLPWVRMSTVAFRPVGVSCGCHCHGHGGQVMLSGCRRSRLKSTRVGESALSRRRGCVVRLGLTVRLGAMG